jgi:hypothetical protein
VPQREHTFVRDEILPSWWANALQAFLSTYAENFHLEQVPASNTQVRVPAGPNDDLAAIAIDGRFRWVEANVVRAMAGAAGTYDVFVVAKDDVIVNVPQPNTDTTDRTFDLRFALTGAQPAAEPGVWALARMVGQLDWDGAKITRFVQLVGDIGLGFGVRTFTIGDGIARSFPLDHNMGTPDVLVEVYETTGNRVTSEFTVERPAGNDNRVTVSVEATVAPPGLNSHRVVIVARASQAAPVPAGHGATHLPGGSDPSDRMPLVTVLPAAPVDGQMCRFLADAAAGVEWHLVYRAASASPYKWECIGGHPLVSQTSAQQAITAGANVFQAVTGISVVQPLAGDYFFEYGAGLAPNSAAQMVEVAVLVNGADPALPHLSARTDQTGGGNIGLQTTHRKWRLTASGLPATWTMQMRRDVATGAPAAQDFALAMMPVRVG